MSSTDYRSIKFICRLQHYGGKAKSSDLKVHSYHDGLGGQPYTACESVF
jgi:hypothetical protein